MPFVAFRWQSLNNSVSRNATEGVPYSGARLLREKLICPRGPDLVNYGHSSGRVALVTRPDGRGFPWFTTRL